MLGCYDSAVSLSLCVVRTAELVINLQFTSSDRMKNCRCLVGECSYARYFLLAGGMGRFRVPLDELASSDT